MFSKKILAGALSVGLLAASSSSSAFILNLQNWGFDANLGGGIITPIDELAFSGTSYVETTAGAPGVAGSTFLDVGRLAGTQFLNDGSIIFGSGLNGQYELTAVFDIPGVWENAVGDDAGFSFDVGGGGTLLPAGTALRIYIDDVNPNGGGGDATVTQGTNIAGDGSLQGYDDGTLILEASVFSGGGNLDLGELDGNVDIEFEVSFAADGYWFVDSDLDGTAETDLDDVVTAGGNARFGVTDSNNDVRAPSDFGCDGPGGAVDMCDEFLEESGIGDVTDPGLAGGLNFFIANDGSFQLATQVSEPSVLALAALGMLGMGGVARRRQRRA